LDDLEVIQPGFCCGCGEDGVVVYRPTGE